MLPAEALAVLDFWFRELTPRQWFQGGRSLDEVVRARFHELLARARRGECDGWAATPRGRVALVIVLDQFPRHIHRGHAEAFASDIMAQRLALEAMELGIDTDLDVVERHFLYLPLMHAENADLQAASVIAYAGLVREMEQVLEFARAHQEQVRRFGRFPWRNAALHRQSTPEEAAFIASGAGAFG